MKFLGLILFVVLYMLSCKEESVDIQIKRKSGFIDALDHSIINNTQSCILREGPTPSYQITRLDHDDYGYAIISIKPKLKINKNFNKDTIDQHFLTLFELIDCQYLLKKDSFIRADFRLNKRKYILYKNPLPNMAYLPFDTTLAIKVDKKWHYIPCN